MGLLSKEGLKSKALLPLHKMVNYAEIGVVVMQLLRTPVDPSQPWHCWCLQRRSSETERGGEVHLLIEMVLLWCS